MIVAVDTETTGLDAFKGDKPFALISHDEYGKSLYRDIRTEDYNDIHCQCIGRSTQKVFHNAKFDIVMLSMIGTDVHGPVHDTMIMSHIYNSDEKSNALKYLSKKYLKEENDEEEQIKTYMRKHKLSSYADVPRELMEPYARKDARLTMELYQFYAEKGVMRESVYETETKILHCLISMYRRGVLIDTGFCRENVEAVERRVNDLQTEINEKYGEINVRSSNQLADFLFHKCGLKCDNWTEKGNPAFDELNLRKYDHPIVPLVLEIRELTKIKTTYLEALQEKADENNVIHCDFHQTGTRTGRFSCSRPNLQNIPRSAVVDVRKAFICRPGYVNYYIDYSQVELRILAHYSQEPLMLEEYNKTDNDLHSVTCKAVFGEVTKQKRSLSKNINFGIIYGMGPKKFCEMVNTDYPDFNMTYTQAREFINKYYATYQKVRTFTLRVPQKILEVGYVHDVFERKYTCPRGESYKGVNYLIQGCAAGIIKKAMIDIDTLLSDKKSNLLLTIHDELVVEIHNDEEHLVAEIVKLMEDHDTFRVPILVNVERTATDWSQKESFDVSR